MALAAGTLSVRFGEAGSLAQDVKPREKIIVSFRQTTVRQQSGCGLFEACTTAITDPGSDAVG